MKEAYRLTRKDGAPGIDGVTADDYATNLEANLLDLLDRLGVASQNTLAAFVHDAEVELRISVPLLGQRMPEPERRCILAASRSASTLEREGGRRYASASQTAPRAASVQHYSRTEE
jgi:hypothetical protein